MPQNQCPWCGRLGGRYEEGTPRHEQPGPHDDGSACVCRHVTCNSRQEALIHGGRYFDEQENRWACPSCGTAPPPSDEELYAIEENIYKRVAADLANANLARADLAGAHLTGADLTGTHLAGTDLTGTDLTRANLARALLAD